MTSIDWTPPHSAFRALLERFSRIISPLYVVGGTVRDHLLHLAQQDAMPAFPANPPDLPDVDLVVERNAMAIARRMGDALGWAYYPLDAERDVARLVYKLDDGSSLICDVTGLQGRTIHEDLLSRDFTVNAMALEYVPASGHFRLLDICGGQADLGHKTLRRVTQHSLPDDPVRLLRAVRLSAQLGLTIEPATRAQIIRLAHRICEASPERLRDELWKALSTRHPQRVIQEMQAFGLLSHVLPEVAATSGVTQSPPHYFDVYQHTLHVVEQAALLRDAFMSPVGAALPDDVRSLIEPIEQGGSNVLRTALAEHFHQRLASERWRAQWLVWHALLHDIGKPQTRTVETMAETTAETVDAGGDPTARVRFFRHEQVGAEMASDRLSALRFSRREIALAATAVRCHMRPHALHDSFDGQPISRRAIYRYYRACDVQANRPVGVDVALLALADFRAIYNAQMDHAPIADPSVWRAYGQHIRQLLEFGFAADGWGTVRQRPLVNGHVLIERFDLAPGPALGQLLEELTEAQVAGEIHTPEEALQWAQQRLSVTSSATSETNRPVCAPNRE